MTLTDGGVVHTTNFSGLIKAHQGKVRDMYAIPGHDDKLLMVATDRISAYDVVMKEGVLGKGAVLTDLSLMWFDLLSDIVENHLITANVDEYPEACQPHAEQLKGRSMLVKKATPLPIECIVRGYISGSFWSAYKKSADGIVCGFQLPSGMMESEKFPKTLFTPSTKAEQGLHDENISIEQMEEIVGVERAGQLAAISLALYERAAQYARERGIIIADTKFEIGEIDGKLVLIDEVLTPDSSRFWPADDYEVGKGQSSFDKQFLRDYLSGLDWGRTPPAPPLPDEVLQRTAQKYAAAQSMLSA